MEHFRDVLKKRLTLAVLYNACMIALIVLGNFLGRKYAVPDFIMGFNTGVCIGVQAVMIYYMGKYVSALKSEEKRRALYIEENDERSKYIQAQIGGIGINIILGGLALGTIVSGFFQETVFYTMLGTLIVSVLVKGALKLYYSKTV